MKQTWKRVLSVLLAGLLLCGVAPTGIAEILSVTASATESGTCGENLTWTLTDDGALTISGTGDMGDFGDGEQPWFAYRGAVRTVVLEDGVTSIGEDAFAYCESMKEIKIPSSVTRLGGGAFWACSSLTSITIPNGVTSIGSGAFDGSALTSIIIPDSVTSMGDYTFWYCSNLSDVTIGNGVTSIGYETFCGCASLTSITIPDSVTSIGDRAFADCTSLEKIVIPDSVTCLGDYMFRKCSNLANVTIGNGVTSIGRETFYGCTSIANITIPDSVTSIDYYAFEDCTSLTSMTIPDGVTEIESLAFAGCTSLADITVSSRNDAYSSLNGVLYNKSKTELICYPAGKQDTTFKVPDTVTTIDIAFLGCANLVNIRIPEGVTYIGGDAFRNCKSLSSINLPSSLTVIRECLFYGCTSLSSIEIPNGISRIEIYAFADTGLERITLPDSVTDIWDGAFENCSSLTDVYYLGSEENWKAITIGQGNTDLLRAVMHFTTVQIHNYIQERTVDYRTTITFSADLAENPVDGAEVHWFINNQDKGAGEQYTEKEAKATYTVQAKYMKEGKVLAESEIEMVNVKSGFFAKLKAFFRALFGRLPKDVQNYVGIEVIDHTMA